MPEELEELVYNYSKSRSEPSQAEAESAKANLFNTSLEDEELDSEDFLL